MGARSAAIARQAAVFGLPVLMIALFVAAVCAPLWVYRDQAAGLSDLERRYVKNQVGRPELPALVSQITDAEKRSEGPPPDIVGRVTYRTLFGVPVGEAERYGPELLLRYDHGVTMLLGAAFLAVEAALFGVWGWLLWTGP